MEWRIGHFYRQIPQGYEAFWRGEIETLPHPGTEALNRDITVAIRGPLWDRARVGAIWRLMVKDYGLTELYAHGDVSAGG